MIKNFHNTGIAVPAGVFILLMCVYLLTLSPTVNFNDSGELISAVNSFGIPHPTGYPFYSAAGRIASIFFPGNPAFRVNLLSAIFAALAGVFVSLTAIKVIRKLEVTSEILIKSSAIFAGLLYGCSLTLWQHATTAEVYSITAFFYSLAVYIIVLWISEYSTDKKREQTIFLSGAYVFGLAFTNHMSAIHLISAFAVLLLIERKWLQYKKPALSAAAILVITGISWYIFLPVRSASFPLMNWGNPHDFHYFIQHVTGRQYRVWMFSGSFAELSSNFMIFVKLLGRQFSPLILVFAVPGLVMLFKRFRLLAITLTVICVSNIAYSINYSIPDIDPYYLPVFLCVTIFAFSGIAALFNILSFAAAGITKISGRVKILIIVTLFSAGFLHTFFRNHYYADLSSNRLAETMAKDLFKSVEPGSVVMLKTWDLYTMMLYYQVNEDFRKDVLLIDQRLLRRSWYLTGLMKYNPGRFVKSRPAIEAFLKAVRPFEYKEEFDSNVIQRFFVQMIDAIIDENYSMGAVYIDAKETPEIAAKYVFNPENLLNRLKTPGNMEIPAWKLNYTISEYDGFIPEREASIIYKYYEMSINRGAHFMQNKNFENGAEEFTRALKYFPAGTAARYNLSAAYMMSGKLKDAETEIMKLIEQDPKNKQALSLLVEIHRRINNK